MRDLLGGKARGSAEMANLGLPVPPGFTITSAVCTIITRTATSYPRSLEDDVAAALAQSGASTGKGFGDGENRCWSRWLGARASMPGMMDTVLNLGLNVRRWKRWRRQSGDQRFAYDSYRRFITMYSDVVLGIDQHTSRRSSTTTRIATVYMLDTDLSADDWVALVGRYKERSRELGEPFPQTRMRSCGAPSAPCFGSWMNQRAITYRRLHDIPESWGTAVNVQAMVFGNMARPRRPGWRSPATVDRREAALRRVPDQCPGRGRGRRHPHPAGDYREGAKRGRFRQAVDGARHAWRVQGAHPHLRRARAALRDMQTSSSRSSRTSCGCCRPAREAHRQAALRSRSSLRVKA